MPEGRSGRLAGKVCLIGGAANGIGEAVTRRFADEGATLWLLDIAGDDLHRFVEDLAAKGATVHGTVGDASSSADVDAWVAACIAEHGSVDVLYNNVGISRPALVADITDEDWRFQLRMTLDTAFFATRAVLPHMVAAGKGAIVSMSSGAAFGGSYQFGAYAAAKAGVVTLMEQVAMEYGHLGIRANSLTPGLTATKPMLAHVPNQPGGVEAVTRELVLRRASLPEEVANTVLWLASDESSNVSGICVRSNVRAAGRVPG